ncbi:MAG TPA: hypothetical protein VJ248_09760 [Candidatus Udaeobacter sp.]|nr:hypothetical protein [Candidatus Udaeobacter sp.]
MGVDACMFLKVKEPISDDQILGLARDAFHRFGDELFVLHGKDHGGWSDSPRHCISRIDRYEQDGDDIEPENGETFLEVHLSGRYYGIDYESGRLPVYLSLAEYFEKVVPGVEVWYGGDSSGICAEKFDKKCRDNLFGHFCKHGHTPYQSHFDEEKSGPECNLCKVKTIRNGWGAKYASFFCPGCSVTAVERDGKPMVWNYKEHF